PWWTPCPGTGKVARRKRVRNLAMAFLKRTPHGLLGLALLALAACAVAPPRAREAPPALITPASEAMPVAVAAPVGATYAPIVPTVAPEASTAATLGSTPAPITPTVAPVASAPAPAAATAATDASAPAPMDASVSGL